VAAADLPFPTSLCHGCAFLRSNRSNRGSVFLQCTEASRPKYGAQPVLVCAQRRSAPPDGGERAAPPGRDPEP
jgi:hypothetical protein